MANNFNFDESCVAVWNFEDGVLTTDSSSGGTNTLTATNSPSADFIHYKEGASSTRLTRANQQYYSITDANLSADFPLKSAGYDTGTFLGWYRPVSVTYMDNCLFYKKHTNGETYSIYNGSTNFNINWGGQNFNTSISIAIDTWYHVAFTFDGLTGNVSVRIFRESDNQVFTYSTTGHHFGFTFDPTLSSWLQPSPFCIGSTNGGDNVDGYIDEVVVFNRVLNNDEIDAIRDGVYATEYTIPDEIDVTQIGSVIEWVDPSQLEIAQIMNHVEWIDPSWLEMAQYCIQVEYDSIKETRLVYQELIQMEYQNLPGIYTDQVIGQLEHKKYRRSPSDGLMIVFKDKPK